MAPKKYMITANKPDGTFIKLTDRDMDSITIIQSAMEASNYTNIKVKRDLSADMLIIHQIMEANSCTKKEAVNTYKRMSKMMAVQGVQFI